VGEKSIIEQTDDISDVVGEELVYHGAGDITVLKAEIIAVIGVERYISCRMCDRIVVEINEMLGKCGNAILR